MSRTNRVTVLSHHDNPELKGVVLQTNAFIIAIVANIYTGIKQAYAGTTFKIFKNKRISKAIQMIENPCALR